MVALAVMVVFVLVVLLVGLPLRAGSVEAADERERRDIEALEAAKRAKYREIRELELDVRTGKLTEDDYRVQDRDRRAEAVELLRQLDALGAGPPPAGAPAAGGEDTAAPLADRPPADASAPG